MSKVPHTSFAAAPALTTGREMTAKEVEALVKKRNRNRVIAASVGLLVAGGLFAAGAQLMGDKPLPVTKHYTSGKVHLKSAYLDGQHHGPFEAWYRNGDPKAKGQHERGMKVGAWTEWDADGMRRELTYLAGLEQGPMTETHPDGHVRIKGQYMTGEPDGVWTWFRPDGSRSETITYRDGRGHGETLEYAANGTVTRRSTYVNGYAEGLSVQSSPAGVLRAVGLYERGRREGTWLRFDSRGALIGADLYTRGDVDAAFTIEAGAVTRQTRWLGRPGETVVFKDGAPARVRPTPDDEAHERPFTDADRALLFAVTVPPAVREAATQAKADLTALDAL